MGSSPELAPPDSGTIPILRDLFDRAEDGILALGPDFIVLYANPAAHVLSGAESPLIGQLAWRSPVLAGCGLEANCLRAATQQTSVRWEVRSPSPGKWLSFRTQHFPHGGWHVWISDITAHQASARERDSLLEAIIEQSQSFIVVMRAPDFLCELVSPGGSRLYPGRVIQGRPVADVFPEVGEQLVAGLQRVLDTGQPFHLTNLCVNGVRRTGGPVEEAYFNASFFPLPNTGDGGSPRVLAMGSESTGEVVAARRAQQLAAGTEAIFANITDAVLIADCSGHILSVNPAAVAMFGKSDPASLGDLEIRTMDGGVVPLSEWPLAQIVRGEKVSGVEVEVRIPRRELPFYVSCAGAIARDSAGDPLFAVLILRDITERKNYESALRSSEERRALALEAAGMGAWSHEIDTGVIHLSPRCREIFGLPPGAAYHFSALRDSIHPEDRPRILADLQLAMESQSAFESEFRMAWPDSSEHWISSRGRASYGPDGRPILMRGVSLDITQRKNTEVALRQTTGALRTVIDACPLAIFTVDLAGKVQTWNTAALKIFGWTEAEVVGRHAPCVPNDCVSEHIAILDRVLLGSTVWDIERSACAKGGSPVLVSFSAAPLRGADDAVYGAVFVLQDVTDTRAIERELHHTQKLESLGVLAGGVAHDFNNLLTGILGNASLAMDSVGQESPLHMMLDEIVRASERAADLTRQMLAYAGKGRFVTQSLDLSLQVRDIDRLIRSSIPRKVHVIHDLPRDLPLIEGDPSQIQQIVMNLVINAAEAIQDQQPGTVLISTCLMDVDRSLLRSFFNGEAASPGAYVSLQVHDTGRGMDEATRLRIFDPFFSTKFTGRGLGLSAVLGIVRSHKGALRVTSAPGEGTSFTILFPATAMFPQPLPERVGAVAVRIPAEPSVDAAALLRAGFRVAGSAEQGDLAAVVAEIETMEEFMAFERSYPATPIVVCTGRSDVEAMRALAGCRAAGFIRKPYTTGELISKLRAVLP